jgi:Zn ribbon nucleic-acid-binding protein
MEPKTLTLGDACPACSGELKPAFVPSDEQYRKAFDKENPIALPTGADTANADVRGELGALHRCVSCGYQARFKSTEKKPTKGKKGDDE